MASQFQSLTGMRDILAPESQRWVELTQRFGSHFGLCGYEPVVTPMLEDLALFARMGEGTDVVTKEMYELVDRDGSTIALRPESTAGVARAFLQHHPTAPWKVWYFSQHFRHERPQKGRYRQHHQLGAECFGSPDPDVDVEMIVSLWDFFSSLGLSQLRLEINSIGTAEQRQLYCDKLRAYLAPLRHLLDPVDAEKVESHPMRVLDSKKSSTIQAIHDAPTLLELLDSDAAQRFDRVLDGVNAAGISTTVNPRLVRGLDYYTHTVFEIVSDAIGAAQSTIGGGGRYDGLVGALGGPETPGVGFGAGVERILLACDAEQCFGAPERTIDAFIVEFGGDGTDGRDLALLLRRSGIGAERCFDQRSGRAQMKQADRSGARFALIIGDDERAADSVTVRPLRGDGEQRLVTRDALIDWMRGELAL